MIWSFSAHGTFRKCPRQWFFRKVLSNWRANDPIRREAHRLSKLEGIHAWRGKIVDTVISETIIPSVIWKRACSIEMAKRKAEQLFTVQRSQRTLPNGDRPFFESEYGLPLSDAMFSKARIEIMTALENFYKAEPVWALFQQAEALVPQRPLSFKHGTVSARVVPDLITFRGQRAPAVLDWKVNARPLRDYWLQLVAGAIAVTRCNPHRDWPDAAGKYCPQDVELLEVQLLTGDVRVHIITENDVHDAEDFITISAAQMDLACKAGDVKSLTPEDFPVASAPESCQVCAFKKLCWRVWT